MGTRLRRTRSLLGSLGLTTAVTLIGVAPVHGADTRPVVTGGAVVLFDVVTTAEAPPRLEITADGTSLAPESTDVVVDGDAARTRLPDQLPAGYAGIVDPGTTVYQVPGTPTDRLPALGWSTARLSPDAAGQPSVVLSVDVAGPGDVVVYGAAADGSLVRHLDTRDGAPDDLPLAPGSTGWPTWVFSEPGSYLLEARPTLTYPGGAATTGPTARYRVRVTDPVPPPVTEEPPPSDPADPPGGGTTGEQAPAPAPTAQAPGGTLHPGTTGQQARDAACEVPGAATDAVVAADGHFDYGVQVHDGTLRARVKDDRTEPPVWRRPDAVVFALGAAARKQVPDAPAYSFLGAVGDPVWTIGQTQEDGVPWLGWNTQHSSATAGIDGATTWRIDAVEGPGSLFVYQTGAFGTVSKVLSTAAGWPRSTRIPANTHGHGTWSFTAPGVYRVTTTHTATLRSGRTASHQDALLFRVGPCAASEPPGGDPSDPPDDPGPTDDQAPEDRPPGDDPAPPLPSTDPSTTPSTVPTRCVPDRADDAGDDTATEPRDDQPAHQNPVSDGHLDFGPEIVEGELVARVKDDRTQPPSWIPPESVRLVLGDAARQQVPTGSTFAFLGDAGDPIWLMPQTQASGVPWLGWNTQHESVRAGVRGSVRFTLDSVSGPGDLAVYLTDSFGGVGQKVFGSVPGFPRTLDVPLNVHAHGNWAFTAAGDYEVAITQSATLTDGSTVSDQGTLHFTVGGEGSPGRTRSSAAPTPDRSAPVPSATVPDETDTEQTDTEQTDTDGTDTDRSAGAEKDCVLPDTGAPTAATALLPLGLVLVVLGSALVVRGRRAARTAAAGA